MQNIPSAYVDGFARGQAVDPERAANYIAHTTIGDPLADAVVADLHSLELEEQAKLIRSGLEGGDLGSLLAAPESVRKFFDSYAEAPDWVDLDTFFPGCRMFHRNTPLVLAGMVGGVLVEGFSTNIAKSFFHDRQAARSGHETAEAEQPPYAGDFHAWRHGQTFRRVVALDSGETGPRKDPVVAQ